MKFYISLSHDIRRLCIDSIDPLPCVGDEVNGQVAELVDAALGALHGSGKLQVRILS